MKQICIFGLLFTWVALSKAWSLRDRDPFPPDYDQDQFEHETERIAEDPEAIVVTEPSTTSTTTTKDPLALHAAAKQNAIQVIFEKMFIALGPDFPAENHVIPSNESLPTVVTPLNITTYPCPGIFAKCSSEIFFPSCSIPRNTNPLLWKRGFNIYFDLPHDLLKTDQLLNATLKLYKNDMLPLSEPSQVTVELHRYLKSLTKKRDIHKEINSTTVISDTIGWVTIDVTELIRNLRPKKNHGFLIKVKDAEDILWIEPRLFVPMDCLSDNISVLPLPFGVQTDQPEQKFPSLLVRTGRPDLYYPELKNFDAFNPIDGRIMLREEGMNKKEEPMLNFYEFARSSKRLYNHEKDRGSRKSHKRPKMYSDEPFVDKRPPINENEPDADNSQLDDQGLNPTQRQDPDLSLSTANDDIAANANGRANQERPSGNRKKSPRNNLRLNNRANSNKRNAHLLQGDPLQEKEERVGEVPYSSIEISIHSNKPLLSIPDIFEPRRHTTRRRRHRQHNKKRDRQNNRKELSASRFRS